MTEVNGKQVTLIDSWFLLGTNYKRYDLSVDIPGRMTHHSLMALSQLGLSECIETIAYVPKSDHLYFTNPDSPRIVFAESISNIYNINSNNNALPIRSVAKRELDGDIVAIASSRDNLYILSVEKSRNASDTSYRLSRYEVDFEGGFSFAEPAQMLLNLNNVIINSDEHIDMVIAEKNRSMSHTIYLTGKALNNPCYADFISTQSRLNFKQLDIKAVCGEVPNICSLHVCDNNEHDAKLKKTSSPVQLLAADFNTAEIYKLAHLRDEVTTTRLDFNKQKAAMVSPCAINKLKYNLRKQNINKAKPDEEHQIYVIADSQGCKLWIITEGNNLNIYPLIGGGKKNSLDKPKNLLDHYVGSVDQLCCINDFGVIAGVRGTYKWFALLLPDAVKTISEGRKSFIKAVRTSHDHDNS